MTFVYSRVDMNMLASRFIDHHGMIPPSKFNISPQKVTIANENFIFQPRIFHVNLLDKFIDAKEPIKPEAFGTQLVDRDDSNSPKNYR